MLSPNQASEIERAAWFSAAPTPFALIDADLRIRGVNTAYERAVDLPRERLIGEHVTDAFPENPLASDDRGPANAIASVETVLRRSARHCPGVVRYDTPDCRRPGEFFYRAWAPVNSPLLDGGRAVAVVHHARDVTSAVPAPAVREVAAMEDIASAAEELRREFPRLPDAEIIGALVHSHAVVIDTTGEPDLRGAATLARLRLEIVAGHPGHSRRAR